MFAWKTYFLSFPKIQSIIKLTVLVCGVPIPYYDTAETLNARSNSFEIIATFIALKRRKCEKILGHFEEPL